MAFYERMAGLAQRFYEGQLFADATLIRSASPATTFDPVRGEVVQADAATRTIPVRAVAQEVTTKANDGSIVSNTILTMNHTAESGDTIELGEMSYTVGEVSTIAPNGVPILWRATVTG